MCAHEYVHGKLGEKHNDITQPPNKEACYRTEFPVSEGAAQLTLCNLCLWHISQWGGGTISLQHGFYFTKPCAVLQTQVFFLTNHLHFMRSRGSLIFGQHCESENIYMTAWVLWRRVGKLILWGGVTVKQHCSKWMAELIPMLTALFHYTNKESYIIY